MLVWVGGGWVLDFTKLMQSHLPTKVEVEVEDELGNLRNPAAQEMMMILFP